MVSGSVLLDTDVYGAVYVTPDKAERQGHPVGRWRRALEGVRVFISFQTRAEVLAGAASSGWGERRMHELRAQLDATPTITADVAVVDAYAQLQAACRKAGHALADKRHAADRWNAACALAKGIPLLARDGIYVDVPGLALFGEGDLL